MSWLSLRYNAQKEVSLNWLKSFLPSAPIENQKDGVTLLIGAGHSTYPQILKTQQSTKTNSKSFVSSNFKTLI